ncbi:hypothetical protein HDE_04615 [Halotydeus destructor]|nr:hypothetical protein HDE_04615 [Halotydeus destructor]
MDARILLFAFVISLSAVIGHCEVDSVYRHAFQELDYELTALEIELKQLDVQLTTAQAYGWREDAADKLKEWRSGLAEALGRFRSSMSVFFKNLTTRDGQRLPDWVYTSASGALDEVVTYIENRMANEDDQVRSVILEVLRNSVRIYRNKVRSANSKEAAKEEL